MLLSYWHHLGKQHSAKNGLITSFEAPCSCSSAQTIYSGKPEMKLKVSGRQILHPISHMERFIDAVTYRQLEFILYRGDSW